MKLHNVLYVNLPAVYRSHSLALEQRVHIEILIRLTGRLLYAVTGRFRFHSRQLNSDSICRLVAHSAVQGAMRLAVGIAGESHPNRNKEYQIYQRSPQIVVYKRKAASAASMVCHYKLQI